MWVRTGGGAEAKVWMPDLCARAANNDYGHY